MVILSVDNHTVQRPIRDVAGGLSHVGHRVVGEHAKRRDGDEVVVEVVLNGRIIVKDIEFQIVGGHAGTVRVGEELSEVEADATATAVKRV